MLARPLRPVQAPQYVQHPDPARPMVGWWWIPAGADDPEPIGHSYEASLLAIHRLLQERIAA